jgi:hypothetical protein
MAIFYEISCNCSIVSKEESTFHWLNILLKQTQCLARLIISMHGGCISAARIFPFFEWQLRLHDHYNLLSVKSFSVCTKVESNVPGCAKDDEEFNHVQKVKLSFSQQCLFIELKF